MFSRTNSRLICCVKRISLLLVSIVVTAMAVALFVGHHRIKKPAFRRVICVRCGDGYRALKAWCQSEASLMSPPLGSVGDDAAMVLSDGGIWTTEPPPFCCCAPAGA